MRHPQTHRRCLSRAQFCDQHGVSEGLLEKEIKTGRLEVAKVGRRVLIPQESIDKWLARAMTRSGERTGARIRAVARAGEPRRKHRR